MPTRAGVSMRVRARACERARVCASVNAAVLSCARVRVCSRAFARACLCVSARAGARAGARSVCGPAYRMRACRACATKPTWREEMRRVCSPPPSVCACSSRAGPGSSHRPDLRRQNRSRRIQRHRPSLPVSPTITFNQIIRACFLTHRRAAAPPPPHALLTGRAAPHPIPQTRG